MSGEIAFDTTTAIRFLNGDAAIVAKITIPPSVVLPLAVVGELLFGAENSARPLENLAHYLNFIKVCTSIPMGQETATTYAKVRHALKVKGRPIPENDIWIAAQCLEQGWTLITDDHHFTYVDGLVVEKW
jgi:tRNA(fMet)-specific endonuclease VapC